LSGLRGGVCTWGDTVDGSALAGCAVLSSLGCGWACGLVCRFCWRGRLCCVAGSALGQFRCGCRWLFRGYCRCGHSGAGPVHGSWRGWGCGGFLWGGWGCRVCYGRRG